MHMLAPDTSPNWGGFFNVLGSLNRGAIMSLRMTEGALFDLFVIWIWYVFGFLAILIASFVYRNWTEMLSYYD